ncbi:hypothetical protein ES705_24965 [subsurface metagenome]
MCLIHHNQAVLGKIIIPFNFLKQDAVSHDLDACAVICLIFKAHGIAHSIRNCFIHLPGNKFSNRQGGYAPGLGNADNSFFSITCFIEDLGNLSCLAGTGGALYDYDLVCCQGIDNQLFVFVYWQFKWVHFWMISRVKARSL